MKINQINGIFNIKNNPIIRQNRTMAMAMPNDCFIKSNEVSFNGTQDNTARKEQIRRFKNSVKKTFLEGPFSIDKIQQAVDKSIQGVEVKPFEERPAELPVSKEWMGVFVMPLGISPEGDRVETPEKTLYISTPKSKNINDRYDSYANAVHEFTHALQSVADDSEENIFNNYLKTHDLSDEKTQRTIAGAALLSNKAEADITKPLLMGTVYNIKSLTKYTQMVMKGRTNMLNTIYKDYGINSIEKFASSVIKKRIAEYEKQEGEIDKSFVYEYIISHFQKEQEAYNNEIQVLREHYPSIFLWARNSKVELYNRIAKLEPKNID